ncbi:MAG: DUF2784 domain-containing protein [Gammaproteobacteria bacterium]|nr:DUF2784 domain-containing protein [Gammaproteobacteria bacterium]
MVLFVVGGLAAIVVGNRQAWKWVNDFRFRLVHLATIGIVVIQAWLDRYCGLTVLESWLRERAGQAGYESGFIVHWIQRLVYFEGPLWVFAVAYTMFAGVVAWAWWRYPPLR